MRILCSLAIFASLTAGLAAADDAYPSPGVRAMREGQWLGSDHLFNLSKEMDVIVELVAPQSLKLPFDEAKIKAAIEKKLAGAGITPPAEVKEDKPPLPFFHLLLMISPIEEGYVIYCDGRLFEQVQLSRVVPAEGTALQAITWEKQDLVFSTAVGLEKRVVRCAKEVVDYFIERVKFFQSLEQGQIPR